MSNQVFFISFGILMIWLLGLSIVLYKLFKLFTKLTRGVEEDLTKKGFAEVKKRLDFLETDGRSHIQKIALIRFNPFKELGGDHSFTLAILDGDDSGVVITGLHTRDRTRVYMKPVKKGKSEYDLSVEERKVLDSAKEK
ncbi:MAG: DUF4446 family protein [Patescibacteria group bacterium]